MAKKEVKNDDINDKSAKVKITSATKNNKTITKSKDVKSNTKKSSVSSSIKNKSTTSKKATSKVKASISETSTLKKASSSKAIKRKSVNESTAKTMLAEYYDLPYRYNQTIVKILAQTPTTLFVYWDISDEDRNSLLNIHGDDFFYKTRPVLIVHNLTHDYSFEVEINDFANSWYIRTQEPNCNYIIELGRKFNNFQNEYIYINSSNNMFSPNDHILFEHSNLGNVLFKNVKTNSLSSKDFGSLRFINAIDKLYGNIYDVYSALYDDEVLNELNNPSSGEFYLKK